MIWNSLPTVTILANPKGAELMTEIAADPDCAISDTGPGRRLSVGLAG